MATTPHLGLYVVPVDDTTTNVMDWVQRVNGTSQASNTMMIDALIAELQTRAETQVIFSATQPENQADGDTWNEILGENVT